MSLQPLLEKFIAEGKEIQLCLRGTAPLGPGKVELYPPDQRPDDRTTYRILTPAEMHTPRGAVIVKMPVIFSYDDLLWISEGPIAEDGSAIVKSPTTGAGGRTPGGIHLPGGIGS